MDQESVLARAYNCYEKGQYEEAFAQYKNLAEQGNVDCQIFVAWMYQKGLGIEENQDEALKWYKQAAELGSEEGQFYLAKWHLKNRDNKAAFECFKRSSMNDYSPALYRLGWIYENGKGIGVDKNKALLYYERSADLGHVFALRNLGRMLKSGKYGYFKRLVGFLFIFKAFIIGIKVGFNDPESVRLRD
ncbi:tetratricopeptide repeat protein [Microbulbifer epialgicus]|uniref:Tetratricopeptide repeat protein n=1 Tax=Microbulbifer epialgicus TaxID=393907 RepID=A0ABV4NXY2_9GAMM